MQSSEDLFNRDGETKSREMDPTAYFKYVAKLIEEENGRIDYYMDEATRKPLLSLVDWFLITNHMQTVVSKGF